MEDKQKDQEVLEVSNKSCPRCRTFTLEIVNFPFEGDCKCTKCKRVFRFDEQESQD